MLELLPEAEKPFGTQSAQMSYFSHHQPEGKFDVLHPDQSAEYPAKRVDAIHRVAEKY